MRLYCKGILLLLGILSIFCVSHAQSGNPFELGQAVSADNKWESQENSELPIPERNIDTAKDSAQNVDMPTMETAVMDGNPFEIGGSNNVKQHNNPIKPIPAAKPKKDRKIHLADSLKIKVDQFKIILSILLLISLALISTLLRHVIIKVFEGFKSDNLLRNYFRSTGRRISLSNILLEAFFVLNAAFTCFLVAEYYNLLEGQSLVEYLKFLMAVSVVVFGKHSILFVIREVFPVDKEVGEYNFTINLFLSILGLILLPCNLILGFASAGMATLMLYFIGLTFVLMTGYLSFRALMIGSKYLSSNRFHFFMYLCTVEIAPLFILVKVVKNYLGS